MSQSTSNTRLAIISQMRVDDLSRIDGNGYSEAVSFSRTLHEVVFICFNNRKSLNVRKMGSNLTIYTFPLSITNSIVQTFLNIISGFLMLITYLPTILKRHRISLIRAENVILGGIPALLANVFLRIPYGLMLLGSEEEVVRIRYGDSPLPRLSLMVFAILKRLVFRRADFVLAVSRREINTAKSLGSKRTGWTTGFVDADVFNDNQRGNVIDRTSSLRFLYAGRLELEKGIGVLLKALDRLDAIDNMSLMIVGKGSLLGAIQHACSIHKNFSYAGYFPHEAMPKILSRADALLLPSFTEGLPAIVLESMLCGIPAVATSVGEVPLLVQTNKTGYLIKPGSSEQLADAIIQMSKNPNQMRRMGRTARIQALALLDNYVDKHLRLYSRILGLHQHSTTAEL